MSSDIRGANQPATNMQDPYGELKLVSVRLDSHAFHHAADFCVEPAAAQSCSECFALHREQSQRNECLDLLMSY